MRQLADAYSQYMRDIAAYDRISPEREIELSDIIQNSHDEQLIDQAVNELVQSNLKLVLFCLKEYEPHLNSSTARLSNLDLIEEGNIGLMKAARTFKAIIATDAGDDKTIRFCTYACKCIKSHMLRAIRKSRFIHIPEHHFTYWSEIEAIRKEAGTDDVSADMISQRLHVTDEAANLFLHSANSGVLRLEDWQKDDDSNHWSDWMPDENAPSPFEETGQNDLRDFLFQEIAKLPPRTGKMISIMYFNESTPTLKNLADMFGVSSERCRQICAQGLKHLRRQLNERFSEDTMQLFTACEVA